MVKAQKKEVAVKPSSDRIEKALVENFVSLQKVLVSLSIKIDNLTEKTSRLLDLFEASAKSFMEKGGENDVSKKIDSLLEQNKTLAKGIAMVYEKPESSLPSPQIPSPPVQGSMEGYQRSVQIGESANISNSRFKPLPKRENA
ncbi:MAG TPA: hypothetical protein VMC80_02320 [Patescibacteria group bacterium]|nr:hypothetical protein [Patescibacteria group bacterium]